MSIVETNQNSWSLHGAILSKKSPKTYRCLFSSCSSISGKIPRSIECWQHSQLEQPLVDLIPWSQDELQESKYINLKNTQGEKPIINKINYVQSRLNDTAKWALSGRQTRFPVKLKKKSKKQHSKIDFSTF